MKNTVNDISNYIFKLVAESDYYPNESQSNSYISDKNSFTAFMFQGKIITNLQNVINKSRIYVATDKTQIPLKLIGQDNDSSIAILKPVDETITTFANDFPVQNSLSYDQQIKFLSYQGIFRGYISKITNTNFFMIDRKVSKKQNGSLVLNDKNMVVGMVIDTKHDQTKCINFAYLANVMKELIKYGRVRKGNVGLTMQGNVVMQVEEGSPAYIVEIPIGAKIVQINNKPFSQNILDNLLPNQVINLAMEIQTSSGKIEKINAIMHTVEKRIIRENITLNNLEVQTFVLDESYIQDIQQLPSELQDYAANIINKLPNKLSKYKSHNGILVLNSEHNSIFKSGDIIKTVSGVPASISNLNRKILLSTKHDSLVFHIIRNKKEIVLTLPLAKLIKS